MSVKARFIRNILEEEGESMLRRQGTAILSKLETRSGTLEKSRSVSVSSGSDSFDGKMTFQHVAYERFLDLRRLRYGSKVVSRRRKIHNRYVFGAYSRIAERLMYEFTDEVAASIRQQIENERA